MKLSALLGCCFKSPVTELDIEKAKQRVARLKIQQDIEELQETTAPGLINSRQEARKKFFAGNDQPMVDLRKVSEPFNPAPYSA